MSWPAAHRSGSAKYQSAGPSKGGFQKPAPAANDNVNIPRPANDNNRNFPKSPSPPKAEFGRRIPPAALKLARRSLPAARLLRVVPWLGWGLAAYDFYRYVAPMVSMSMASFDKSKYTANLSCGGGGVRQQRAFTSCPTQLYAPFVAPTNDGTPGTIWTWEIDYFDKWLNNTDWFNMKAGVRYTRNAGVTQRAAWPRQATQPAVAPSHWPAVDPFVIPPLSPTPDPIPLPRNAVPSHRPRSEEGDWSERGPSRQPRVRPAQWHVPRRPTDREVEKKGKLRSGFSIALKGGYAVMEGKDFVEALFDGVKLPGKDLPPAFKNTPKGLTTAEKALWMAKNWDQIDITQAILNLAANHVIDAVVGTTMSNANQFATELGISYHNQLLSGGIRI